MRTGDFFRAAGFLATVLEAAFFTTFFFGAGFRAADFFVDALPFRAGFFAATDFFARAVVAGFVAAARLVGVAFVADADGLAGAAIGPTGPMAPGVVAVNA